MYLNDFYVSGINWAETFLFEKYESAHLATACWAWQARQKAPLVHKQFDEKRSYRATTTMYILLHSLKKILSFYTVGATWKVCNLATKEPQY